MSRNVVDQYSGVVINQNQVPAASDDWLNIGDQNWRYQEVFLPSDYVRGDDAGHQIIPPLTGWQLLVGIPAGTRATASLDWNCAYQQFGVGWVPLASGRQTGAHAEGDKVWFDMPFDEPADLTFETYVLRLRFGFRLISGINKVWYSNPNPLALRGFAKLRASDGLTAIQDIGSDVSVLFRVLGLTADSGTDFLGNTYRSAIRSNVAENTTTVDGAKSDAIYMSEPSPSRFAVKSLYYDVRQPTPTRYGRYNFLLNPSYEAATAPWTASNSTLALSTAWALAGSRSLLVTGTAQTTGGVMSANFKAVTGRTYTASVTVNPTQLLANGIRVAIDWFDLSSTLISTSTGVFQTSLSIGRPFVTAVAPAGAQTGRMTILTTGASGNFSFALDGAMVNEGGLINYFDGDTLGHHWTGVPHNSSSVEVTAATIADDQAVVDNVLVDPVTPGVWFTVYYSSEGSRADNEDDWENKLWTRVPGTFQALKRERHKLPEPITCKYIKIEFSHLQARSYNPGDFAKPVSYKKHPKWVLDYFLARLDAQNALEDKLGARRVGVIFDAIDLAYNYYLDDLKQEPTKPVEIDSKFTNAVTSFLANQNDLSDRIDSDVLAKVNLSMEPYKNNPLVFAKNQLITQQAQATPNDQLAYPVEEDTTRFPDVGTLRNTEVVMDNDMPVMFFYLTCRHKYREVVAPFSHDRAYFVGIREIAFTRERYTAAYDEDTYVEPGGDLLNTKRNEFVNVDGILSIGASNLQRVSVGGVIQ